MKKSLITKDRRRAAKRARASRQARIRDEAENRLEEEKVRNAPRFNSYGLPLGSLHLSAAHFLSPAAYGYPDRYLPKGRS